MWRLFLGLLLCCWVLPAQAQDNQDIFSIEGMLIQGTPNGAPLPENLPLLLKILDATGQTIGVKQTNSQPDFRFQFDNLPHDAQHFYVVTATWAGIEQTTTPLTADLLGKSLEFPLYETTESIGDVVAYRGNVRLEFADINQVGVQLLIELSYTNLGDRIVWNSTLGQSLVMELPVGAYGFAAEVPSESASNRYQFVDQIGNLAIPAVKDSLPLTPNFPNVMRISFFVPYDNGAIIDMRLPLALDDFRLFMRDDLITLESEDLQLTDETETSSGRAYQIYAQVAPFEPNQPIQFTLLGEPSNPESTPAPIQRSSGSNAVILLGVGLAIVFSGMMLWLMLIRRANNSA